MCSSAENSAADRVFSLTSDELGDAIAAAGSAMQYSVAAAVLGMALSAQLAIVHAIVEGVGRELGLSGEQCGRIVYRAGDLIEFHARVVEDAGVPDRADPLIAEVHRFVALLRSHGQRFELADMPATGEVQ